MEIKIFENRIKSILLNEINPMLNEGWKLQEPIKIVQEDVDMQGKKWRSFKYIAILEKE